MIWVTENGVSVPDESNESLPGVLDDTFRINFYRDYMQAAMAAISEDQARACSLAPALAARVKLEPLCKRPLAQVNIQGYFCWSLLDNWCVHTTLLLARCINHLPCLHHKYAGT